MSQKIWFITGISSGLGKALAQTALRNGDLVAGTFRHREQADAFQAQYPATSLALLLDITQPADSTQAFQQVIQKWGRIDVLVNNAGYGMAGAIEETSLDEARALFETNFFGTLAITQNALPFFRQQKSGHIIQISSHGGVKGFAGFGIYNASKFAVEGFSEALAQEVAPLGIQVTLVEPGPFRTAFAGKGFVGAKRQITDYQTTAGVFRERIKGVDGKQEGDPDKAAEAIYMLTTLPQPPLRLPLGKVAVHTLTAKLESVKHDLEAYRKVAEEAVF